METKTVVVAKDGKAEVLLGNHIIALEDNTTSKYTTNDIADFCRYVNEYGKECTIYFDNKQLLAFDDEISYKATPKATCTLEASRQLLILGSLTTWRQQKDFKEGMTNIKKHGDESYNHLLSLISSLKIEKITSYESQSDNHGNVLTTLCIKDSKEAKQDVSWPEFVSLTIPVFKFINDTIDIKMEFRMNWEKVGDDKVTVHFCLYNIDLPETIEDAERAIVRKILASVPRARTMWGQLEVISKTDDWKYKINAAPTNLGRIN